MSVPCGTVVDRFDIDPARLRITVAPSGDKDRDSPAGAARSAEGCGCDASTTRIAPLLVRGGAGGVRSEEHTSELQSLMRTSYAVFCLKKKIEQQYTRAPS